MLRDGRDCQEVGWGEGWGLGQSAPPVRKAGAGRTPGVPTPLPGVHGFKYFDCFPDPLKNRSLFTHDGILSGVFS